MLGLKQICETVSVVILVMSRSLIAVECSYSSDAYHAHRIVKQGDINFGGIFSMHKPAITGQCGTQLRDPGVVQYAQAMIYAIEVINKDPNILGNLTLGYVLMDDCATPAITIRQATHFMNFGDTCIGDENQNYFYNVAGIIGAESSTSTIMISNVLRDFAIPVLSPFATGDALNNREKYPYVLRMVPSDRYQVEALFSLIVKFKWNYFSILYAKGEYGEGSNLRLRNLAAKHNLCVALSNALNPDMQDEELEKIVNKLYNYYSRVVVLFTDQEETHSLFKIVKTLGFGDYFVWLGGDGLGLNIDDYDGLEEVALESLSLTSFYQTPEHEFYRYFESLTPRNCNSPWFKDMWELLFKCSVNDTKCVGINRRVNDSVEYTKEISVSSIIDSVYIYAKALENWLRQACPEALKSPDKLNYNCKFNHSQYFAVVQNTTLESKQGLIKFGKNGHVLGKYQILNYQRMPDGSHKAVRVGIWETATKDIFNLSRVQWTKYPNGEVPNSHCGRECGPGEIYSYHKDTCCWECRRCKENEIVDENNSKCESCPLNHWPDVTNYSTCLPLTPESISWLNPLVLFFVTVCVLGTLFCLLILALFIIHNSHRLIKATSRELSYIMLGGITLQYCLPAFIITEPTPLSCYFTYMCFNISFSIVYAPLLTRTNRIFRIFHSGKRTTSKPSFISPVSQVVIASFVISVQVILSIATAVAIPPKVELRMPKETEALVEKTCTFHIWGFVVSLTYNLLLILVCSFYAFKTRKLPDNFNESRYIALSVYTTLVIWTVFLPSYFVNNRAFHQVILLCSASLLNATVMILCLYLPKIYATVQNTEVTKFGYRTPASQNMEELRSSRNTIALDTTHTYMGPAKLSGEMNRITCNEDSLSKCSSTSIANDSDILCQKPKSTDK